MRLLILADPNIRSAEILDTHIDLIGGVGELAAGFVLLAKSTKLIPAGVTLGNLLEGSPHGSNEKPLDTWGEVVTLDFNIDIGVHSDVVVYVFHFRGFVVAAVRIIAAAKVAERSPEIAGKIVDIGPIALPCETDVLARWLTSVSSFLPRQHEQHLPSPADGDDDLGVGVVADLSYAQCHSGGGCAWD